MTLYKKFQIFLDRIWYDVPGIASVPTPFLPEVEVSPLMRGGRREASIRMVEKRW
jgi:hypothetical protein